MSTSLLDRTFHESVRARPIGFLEDGDVCACSACHHKSTSASISRHSTRPLAPSFISNLLGSFNLKFHVVKPGIIILNGRFLCYFNISLFKKHQQLSGTAMELHNTGRYVSGAQTVFEMHEA